MANTVYKILGQLDSTGTTNQDIYTVPTTPATNTIVSTIVITNRSLANQSYSILVRKNGASAANAQYIAYNSPVPALDAVALTLGLSLGANDVITANSSTAYNVSFNIFGTELS